MRNVYLLKRQSGCRGYFFTAAIVLGLFSISSHALAATYYVATNGSNSNNGSSATPFLTVQKGLSSLAPGDALLIRDGTYSGSTNALTNLPNGTTGKYITIQAENEGKVIISSGLNMAHTNAYLQFVGLRFQDTGGRVILGNHLKFFRNEFRGGCSSGNCVNTQVGSNDVSDTADILFEDNWFHGLGGRYNLLIYNSNRVVVRRAVIRHDGGWTDNKGDPEAGINFYNSSNCSAQNIIVLDNTLSYQSWQGAIYNVYNSASPNSTNNNSWYGNIALNSRGAGFIIDGNGSQSGHIVQDLVSWDVDYGMNMGTGSTRISGMSVNRVTTGHTNKASSANGLVQWASWSGSITNTIITNVGSDLINLSATYFDSYGNSSTSKGTGSVTYNPRTNGLLYLTRIESGSPLKSDGSGGGQIGAQIVNTIGAPGSLYGETGWNTDTGSVLWPFPNESRIKKEMCTDAGITRGFCSSSSLTYYIMNYLGNGNPYSGDAAAPLPAPTNLKAL
jgi:hypothetical protein